MDLDRRQLLATGAAAALAGPALAQPRMVKTVTFMMRRYGHSHAEFMRYWIDVHGALAQKTTSLKGLIFTEITGATNQRKDIAIAPDQIVLDGMMESWRLDTPASTDLAQVEAERAFHEDGVKFVGQIKGFRVQENVFVRPKRGGKGLLSLINRKTGVSHADFTKHWLTIHGPMAAQVPEVAGLVLNEVLSPSPPATIPVIHELDDIDGIAESWHKDTSYAAVTSPEAKRWYADGADLIGLARGYYTQEHVIIEPG